MACSGEASEEHSMGYSLMEKVNSSVTVRGTLLSNESSALE